MHLSIALVLGGHLVALALDREFWPFSSYPMFSTLLREKDTVRRVRLVALPKDPGTPPFLLVEHEHLRPLNPEYLSFGFHRLVRTNRAAVRPVMRSVLHRYESLRAARRHDGPPLRGVRLCAERWKVDPAYRNVSQPDNLLAECSPEESY